MRLFRRPTRGVTVPSALTVVAWSVLAGLVISQSGCTQQPALSHEAGSFVPEAGSVVHEAGSVLSPFPAADGIDELNFDDAPDFFDLPDKRAANDDDDQPAADVPKKAETLVAAAKPTDVPLQPPGPESWPSFRNGNAQLGVATTRLPEELKLKWKFPAEHGVPAPASIVGGRVYVGLLKGDLVCLDLETGELIWSYRSIEDPDPKTFAPGFKAGALVTADAVYVGDEDGVLHAVDRATGKKKWTFQTQAEIAGCPAKVDDHLIIGSHDSNLYCLNAADGAEVWKFETLDRVNCSPAVVGDFTFVAGCDEHLRVINIRTGKQKSDIPLGSYLIASPAVMDNMLYVGTYASEVVAVDWQNEAIVWRYKDPEREFPYHASAAVTDKYVVVGGRDKQMHCIDRKTGERVWVFPTRGRIDSSPVIVADRVFFGSSDRNVYGLRLADGKELWKFNAGEEITAAPSAGEGHLVIGSEGGEGFVYCFGAK